MPLEEMLLNEIEKRKEIYIKSPDDMIAAYNREEETKKDYNGRQLLELLQNADDEGSDVVQIELNTEKNTLLISNRGEHCRAFSFEGIKSLMISNLSSKVSKKYIGNKGLGFRSIINWSDKIVISSGGLDIEFSKDIVGTAYDSLFDSKQKTQFCKTRNLAFNVKPIPFLSIPKVSNNGNFDWTTRICIHYKNEFLSDIRDQINDLKDEVLLFLNSLKELTVVVDGEIQTKICRNNLERKWTLHPLTERLPKDLWDKDNEEEWFSLKIALQDRLECDVQELFAFFPTQIHPGFPFIIHGTFELDSSRNHLVKSEKNKFILAKLADLIISTAKSISENEVSYKALQMLQYDVPAPILKELGLYTVVDDAIENLDIFPCVDQTYKQKSEVSYCDDLSKFVTKTRNVDECGFLLIPRGDHINLTRYGIDTHVNENTINILSEQVTDLDERCELIHIVYVNKHELICNWTGQQRNYSLLIDEGTNLIPLTDDVYTPKTKNVEYTLPHFVHTKFLHQGLYEKLLAKFNIKPDEKARELQRELKTITNLHSYEPAQVLQKIVSSANKELKSKDANKLDIINEMLYALYINYKQLPDTRIPIGTKVQVFNEANQLKAANDLFLSSDYPSGELTEFLFGDIFQRDDFLAGIAKYDIFEEQDINLIERFFLWLGVNRHSKLIEVKNSESFKQMLFSEKGEPQDYRDFSASSTVINDFLKISQKLSREKFILWICKDPDIQNWSTLQNNNDRFEYSKHRQIKGSYYHSLPLHGTNSHLALDILNTAFFTDFLIKHESLSTLVNDRPFNFEDPMFAEFDVRISDIEDLLIKLGAVSEFSNLSIGALRRIVKNLPQSSPSGKQAQTIYAHCIKHFETNRETLRGSGIKLFSEKNGELGYYPANEVYYNGSIKLPKNLIETKAVLKYQRRKNTENIIEFFGINDLKTINLEILDSTLNKSATDEFKTVFNRIKPYILAHRLSRISSDKNVRPQLKILNNIDISLCASAKFRVDDNECDLENNDYIMNEHGYLIKVPEHMSVSDLCGDFDFQECFSDIIGLAFSIQETHIFRSMIKENTSYLDKTTRSDLGDDTLSRANNLMHISDGFQAFWSTVYALKGKEYPENFGLTAEAIIADFALGTRIVDFNYAELNTKLSCSCIKTLFAELDIRVESFNARETSYYKIDFLELHKLEFENEFNNQFLDFKQRIYSWCCENLEEGEFTRYLDMYNHNTEVVSTLAKTVAHSSHVDYQFNVSKYIETHFPISNSQPTNADIDQIRKDNLRKLQSQGFQIDDVASNHEHLSYLYFENKLDALLQHLTNTRDLAKPNVTKGSSVTQVSTVEITAVTVQAPEKSNNTSPKRRRAFKHTASIEIRKKEKGEDSELIAYDKLCNEFGKDNVEWVAQSDDGLGYDMKYKNHSGEWKYVEVKYYSGERFYLTLNEKRFAQNHVETYELFLVDKDQIYKITDVNYNDKTAFKVTPDRFVVEYNFG